MCFSKRRTKQIKLWILSPTTESILIFSYLAIYPVSVMKAALTPLFFYDSTCSSL